VSTKLWLPFFFRFFKYSFVAISAQHKHGGVAITLTTRASGFVTVAPGAIHTKDNAAAVASQLD
jgi:hypothetical protein